ncbi:MAG TPA: hypothetical protein VM618_05455 [Acidimicrobiia bacterium]|nr:hypothetical protein [Acidimicrobiia bacterium]
MPDAHAHDEQPRSAGQATGHAAGDSVGHEECYACPVGGFFLTARTASPEALDHLVNAASEMVAAFRSMAEAAERFLDQQRAAPPSAGARVRRIRVED